MLSSDHFGQPARRRRRKARRGAGAPSSGGTAGVRGDTAAAEPRDPHAPWDVDSAEALTRLYESDEGQLHKPHAGERGRRDWPRAEADAAGEPGARGTGWLEAHLADLAERLQASVVRLDRAEPVAALGRRLEAIEERFSTALERITQRADGDGLRSIEAHVLDLAAHLERTRERLEEIGGLEEQVRELAQRLDEADQHQLGALGKVLRDYVAEWRESEQRTANALHNLEEAISRLGDTVDAIEASRPAPDLSLPTLADPEPGHAAHRASDGLLQAAALGERIRAPGAFYSTLDAADYAPKPVADQPLAAETNEPARTLAGWGTPAPDEAAIQWSAEPADAVHGGPAATATEIRASRISAMREKLRQAQAPAAEADDQPPEPEYDPQRSAAIGRARPGLLLLAGAVFLAGGAYLLIQAFMTAAPVPAGPARIEHSAQPPAGAEPAFVAPAPRTVGRAG